MKYITLIAVLAVVLMWLIGAVPESSVGGPMTLMLMSFVAMVTVGIHDAWTKKRGAMGWIVGIVAAIIGGLLAVSLFGALMGVVLPFLGLEGSLASTRGPLLYASSVGMMLATLLGSWIALRIIDTFR